MIRVLIVDDSAVARHMLAHNLAVDSEMEVAGYASNGRLALEKIRQLHPDAVTLDIEMPEMNGLDVLREIRRTHPKLPVIMVSATSPADAASTLDALAIGASDYVVKPAAHMNKESADQLLRNELIPKIKALCLDRLASQPFLPTEVRRGPLIEKIDILAIGTSTGGPNALTEVFTQLPADFPIPIVIVQHMPPMFTELLAARLSAICPFPVSEAKSGDILKPGQAWLAPGDYHMELRRLGNDVKIILHQGERENACRPSVDVLLRSVTEIYGGAALAVIMTGMGSDGLLGCRRLRASNGQIIVQDEPSSVVWGMPGAVTRDGLADKVVPLLKIADEIVKRVRFGRSATRR